MSVIRSFQIEVGSNDPFLMHICTSKLPEETSRAWEDSLSNHKELPTWQQLSQFLTERIETLETFTNLRKSSSRDRTSPNLNFLFQY
ncbi:hypothetical protein CVS40_11160 [Lucilia cuprina]|nr:hypothetical protein CVS40_11160 [Lucilia cuprina]